MRRLKLKYIVNLSVKDTSNQGTKCCVPLCPLKRGSTINVWSELDKTVEANICEGLLFTRTSVGLLQIHIFQQTHMKTLFYK